MEVKTQKKNMAKAFQISLFFNSSIFHFIGTLISNWTSCRTIQGVIVLVISNRPRASHSSDFEITRSITP